MMAIAAILAAIFNMVTKTHKKILSAPNAPITKKTDIYGFLEECDRDQCDFR
jgi:hypothetical protein